MCKTNGVYFEMRKSLLLEGELGWIFEIRRIFIKTLSVWEDLDIGGALAGRRRGVGGFLRGKMGVRDDI